METVASPHPDAEFIYGRVRLDPRVARYLRGTVGDVGSPNEPVELIFGTYARSRDEAMDLVHKVRAIAAEISGLVDDLKTYIENHDFKGEREQHDD